MYALSWRVWVYQTAYPAIPFFTWVPYLGPVPSWLLFEAMLAAFALCVLDVRSREAGAVYLAASALLILQDQHRVQPWALQFALCAAVLTWAEEEDRMPLLIALTAGIYFLSGLQKLNYSFIKGTGDVLIGCFLKPFGKTTASLPFAALAAASLGMGLFEMALAPGLLLPAPRRRAAWGAVAMHATILYCLGPWNLAWNVVVWPWNLMMAAFARTFGGWDGAVRWRRSAVAAAVLAALALPLLRFADRYDAYPAFGMYIDYYHQGDFYVYRDVAGRLPEEIRRHLEPPVADGAGLIWNRLDLIPWSVAAVEVPPYLEPRINAGVAAAVCRRYGLGEGASLVQAGLPALRDGARGPFTLYSGCAKLNAANGWAFNARAVDNLGRESAPWLWLRVGEAS